MGFLLSRRWVLFALVVALLATGAWWLGEWQFHRLEDRKQSNAVTERNLARDPAPVAEVLAPGQPVAPREEWRRVTATGRYLEDRTVVVRYQTRDGASGVDLVTPLAVRGGATLLVDRGWLRTGNAGATEVDAPAPPGGEVTVTGWVRADATGSSTSVSDQSTRAVSSEAIGAALGLEVYGGFVDLASEDPAPPQPLEETDPPDLNNGPHFFYGLQWWFFGALAVFGFGYLAFDERRQSRRDPQRPDPDGATPRRAAPMTRRR